jgi:hypothetical protein
MSKLGVGVPLLQHINRCSQKDQWCQTFGLLTDMVRLMQFATI